MRFSVSHTPGNARPWPKLALFTVGATLALLAGCGGSDSGPDPDPETPPAGMAAPTGVSVNWPGTDFYATELRWGAPPGATRFELFVDPDGPGPLPEAPIEAAYDFKYAEDGQGYLGTFTRQSNESAVNRLRACDASRCGDFSAPQVYDITRSLLHAFPSGLARNVPASGRQSDARAAVDGLTLVVANGGNGTHVYERDAITSPWQRYTLLASTATRPHLSADGDTLAVRAQIDSLHVYRRTQHAWALEATIDAGTIQAGCAAICQLHPEDARLSADGNVIAIPAVSTGVAPARAIVIYTRADGHWTPTAYLTPGKAQVNTMMDMGTVMALSGDGRTLAVNEGITMRVNYGYVSSLQLHIYAQDGTGQWTEQADLPVRFTSYDDFVGNASSSMSLSDDGSTLAVQTQHWPSAAEPLYAIAATDLTCGDPSTWNAQPVTDATYSTLPGWYVGVYGRRGSTWTRDAVIARTPDLATRSSALARDGNALFYDGKTFNRSNGVWACP